MDGQPLRAVFLAQQGDQVPVQLHHMQVRQLFQQRVGERAAAGADFHQGVVFLQPQGTHHQVHQIAVVQKVLAETFAGAVFCHVAASSRASRVAAIRLPALAWPVPARSKAVPWSTEVRIKGSPRVILMASPKPAYLSTGRP